MTKQAPAAERRTVNLAHVRLSQFACHEDLELDLDTITLIRGANRTGKTSILEHRRALYAFAQEWIEAGEPLQMIVTQVSDGPLSVQGWNPGDGVAADLFEGAPNPPEG